MLRLTLSLTRDTKNYFIFENDQEGFKTGQIVAKLWIPKKEFTNDTPPEITIGLLDDSDTDAPQIDQADPLMKVGGVLERALNQPSDDEVPVEYRSSGRRPVVNDGEGEGW